MRISVFADLVSEYSGKIERVQKKYRDPIKGFYENILNQFILDVIKRIKKENANEKSV